jgi:hypothetical protein
MKKHILVTLLSLSTSLLFIGCGSSGGSTSDTEESLLQEDATKNDIILKQGESLVCTTETQFSVEPTDTPLVNFSKDAENGEITIALDAESQGFVTIIGCTER